MDYNSKFKHALFQLEKNGEHDYDFIEAIVSILESKTELTPRLSYLIDEVRDYNYSLRESYIDELFDTDDCEKLFHGLCFRLRMIQKELISK